MEDHLAWGAIQQRLGVLTPPLTPVLELSRSTVQIVRARAPLADGEQQLVSKGFGRLGGEGCGAGCGGEPRLGRHAAAGLAGDLEGGNPLVTDAAIALPLAGRMTGHAADYFLH